MGGLFLDGEDSSTASPVEDISKWSVEEVCGFVGSLAGCAEYTQVRNREMGEGKRESERERRGEERERDRERERERERERRGEKNGLQSGLGNRVSTTASVHRYPDSCSFLQQHFSHLISHTQKLPVKSMQVEQVRWCVCVYV